MKKVKEMLAFILITFLKQGRIIHRRLVNHHGNDNDDDDEDEDSL